MKYFLGKSFLAIVVLAKQTISQITLGGDVRCESIARANTLLLTTIWR
jgi:hypothetical protein